LVPVRDVSAISRGVAIGADGALRAAMGGWLVIAAKKICGRKKRSTAMLEDLSELPLRRSKHSPLSR
jgi:hypothetical protein